MGRSAFRVRGCHPLWPRFPACSAMLRFPCCRRSYNPGRCQRQPRFGLLRVRSPLLAQSLLLSLPAGTKMFQFPAFAPAYRRCGDRSPRVSPFGHRRVTGHLPLAGAFRSLSRPSSPPRATGIPHAPLFAFPLSLRRLFKPRSLLDSRLWMAHGHPSVNCFLTKKVFSRSQHVNDLVSVVPGRLELPTSTLSV